MKKRYYVISVLLINLLIMTLLQINIIKNITGTSTKTIRTCMEVLNYTYRNEESEKYATEGGRVLVLRDRDSEEQETSSNVPEQPQNSQNKDKSNVKAVSSADNINIGIVICNSGYRGIYHDKVILENADKLTIKYGKEYKKSKRKNAVTITAKDSLFNQSDRIKVEASKITTVKSISRGGKAPKYNGNFYIYKTKSGLVLVNDIDVERYLYSVVASEMPSSFEKEALKAQAVCARTYIYKHLDNDKYIAFNAIADDSVSYQAYGTNEGTNASKKAVNDTRGEVMTAKGKLINAYYFSTSCGYTTDYKIWGKEKFEYLKGCYVSKEKAVADASTQDYFNKFIKSIGNAYEKNCTFYRWNVTINKTTIQNKIYDTIGENIGDLKGVEISQRGSGGIASHIKFKGNIKTVTITNQNQLRKILSPYGYALNLNDGSTRTNMELLPSAFITIDKVSTSKYKITGGGFGHGSGMSQYGANILADKGAGYKEILKFFYSGITCAQSDIH